MMIVCPECGSCEVEWQLVDCERLLVCPDCQDGLDDLERSTEVERLVPETELPGMWEYADFLGGQEHEVRGPDWVAP